MKFFSKYGILIFTNGTDRFRYVQNHTM